MIRGTLSLLAIGTSLLHAAVGDWQAWTNVQSPVMATRSGSGIWTASPGGAAQYDTATGKATVFTSLDGLVSTDLVGILALTDTIWSTSSGGDLCRLLPGSRSWEALGSYRRSGWSFAPRVLAANPAHSVLLLGGAQGLSLFSIADGIALDNVSSFGSLADQKVHAVAVTPRASTTSDTIWVGLQDGAAYAPVADWSKVGRGNGILSDPSKWTVFRRMPRPVVGLVRWSPRDSMRTVPDLDFVPRYDTARVSVQDTTSFVFDTTELFDSSLRIDTIPVLSARDSIVIPLKIDTIRVPVLKDTGWIWASSSEGVPLASSKDSLHWNGARSVGATVNHALPFPGGLAVSTQGKGLLLLRANGSIRIPEPPSQLPTTPVHHLQLHPDGTLHAWIGSDIYRLPADRSAWSSSLFTPSSEKAAGMPPNALGQDPAGNLLYGTWGAGLWRYAPVSAQATRFGSDNSCLQPAIAGTGFVVASALSSPTSEGNWTGYHMRWTDNMANTDSNSMVQVAFLPTNGAPRCFPVKERIDVPVGTSPIVLALSAEGDSAVWVAHPTALLRYRIKGDALELSGSAALGNASSIQWLGRRLYVVQSGELKYLEKSNESWRTVLPGASFLQGRGYRRLDVDTLGNLWMSSANGMDILDVSSGSSPVLSQRLDRSSGLLSDDIVSFSLDRSSGTVAFATPLGLSLYQSRSRVQPKSLDRNLVRPFPNPYRKLQHSKVAFPSVDSTAELHIYAADGGLVNHQGSKEIVGDQFLWKPAATVRPGIYFWTISDGSSRLMGRLVIGN